MGNFYDILEVRTNASLEEIKRAYRRMAMRYHPDKNNSPLAAEQFNLIQVAYDTLADSVLKQRYDLSLQSSYTYESQPPPYEEEAPTAPIDPLTGRKNYKYYRTSRRTKHKTADRQIPYEQIFKPKAGYFAFRFWFTLAVAYTVSFFIITPWIIGYTSYSLEISDILVKLPIILFCTTCIIDSFANSQTRIAIVVSTQNFINATNDFIPKIGKIVRFNIFHVSGLNTDYFTKNNSKAEALVFDIDADIMPSKKVKFHYTPLLRFCFKITQHDLKDRNVTPHVGSLIGNLKVYRMLCLATIFFCLCFYITPIGLDAILLGILGIFLVLLKKQSLTS